jgi:hypothetical protein
MRRNRTKPFLITSPLTIAWLLEFLCRSKSERSRQNRIGMNAVLIRPGGRAIAYGISAAAEAGTVATCIRQAPYAIRSVALVFPYAIPLARGVGASVPLSSNPAWG